MGEASPDAYQTYRIQDGEFDGWKPLPDNAFLKPRNRPRAESGRPAKSGPGPQPTAHQREEFRGDESPADGGGASACAAVAEGATPAQSVLLKYATAISVAGYLLFLLWGVASAFYPATKLPWYSNSDENVVVTEVIRFSGLDFRQEFYDMPGTPLMMLGAAEWRVYHASATLLRRFSGGIDLFTASHLQQLFTLMRWNSLLFYLASSLLIFRIVWRLSDNPCAGAAAATLLLFSRGYAVTVPSLRVEPMALFLVLTAIVILTEAEGRSRALWAGVLGGTAAACRMHSIIATVSILTLLLWGQTWGRAEAYSIRFRRFLAILAAVLICGSAALFFELRVPAGERPQFPLAFALLGKALLAVAIVTAAAVGAYAWRGLRPMVVGAITKEFLLLMSGLALGFLAGTPTIFTRFASLLRSLDFYQGPGYRDAASLHLPFPALLSSYLSFYLKAAAPDTIAQTLLIAGSIAAILLYKRRWFLPYLIGWLTFFVSKPLTLARAEHHIAVWAAFYAVLASIPVALLFEALRRRLSPWAVLGAQVLALGLLWRGLTHSPTEIVRTMAGHAERLQNIDALHRWIPAHTGERETFMIAFYCFGPEIFEQWQREQKVFLPNTRSDRREYRLWWGMQSELKGLSGYACLTPEDVGYMKQWELKRAGEGIDPLHDRRFVPVQSFGNGPNQVELLRFNMK